MNQREQQIRPEKITCPIQLLAAWLTGLVLVDGIFLTAATYLSSIAWVAGLLVVASVVNVPLFLAAIFILQTRFRPEMQEDLYSSKYLEEKQKHVELRAKKLREELEAKINLADGRVELADAYIDRVTSKLNLDEAEKARVRRALRQAVKAKEERISHHLNREFVEGFQNFLSDGGLNIPSEATEALLIKLGTVRYGDWLSSLSRVTQKDISQIDLLSSIQRVYEALLKMAERDEKNIEFQIPQQPVNVLATRGILEAILTEVLMNAIAYSPRGSTINVNVSKFYENRIKIEVENPTTDRSIQETKLAKLFEPGYRGMQSLTLFPSGVGMGLHLVNRSIELIGGSVSIEVQNKRFKAKLYLVVAPDER